MALKRIVRLIVIRDTQILLIKKVKSRGARYSLVGGKVGSGETPVKAIIREAYEEAGLLIKPAYLRKAFSYKEKRKSGKVEFIFFQCLFWAGKIEVKEPDRFEKLEWHSILKAPKDASPRLVVAYLYILNRINDPANKTDGGWHSPVA